MNKQREIIRLSYSSRSHREIARIVGCSPNTVRSYRKKIKHSGLDWEDIKKMSDSEVESLLKAKRYRLSLKYMPDWEYIHKQMQYKNVTLQLLWEDYRLANSGNAYGYSQFAYYYKKYIRKLDVTMRQRHHAGEAVFVDFAGQTVPYKNPDTGENQYAQIFVGVLGCSNYTFACAVRSQSKPDWILAHNKMFKYIGGVPQSIIPDNLKSAVTQAGKTPVLNRTYLEMAKHYNVVIIPARVYRPQDKSKAELGVLLVSRWILARLRHHTFFSIDEINVAISRMLVDLNERSFKKLPGCRRSRFLEMDQPLLRALPKEPFEYAEWVAKRKVGPDYHLSVDKHYYSVPHELVRESVETRIAQNTVEFFFQGRRVASHPRSFVEGGHTTNSAHQPKAHRAYADLTPENLIDWASEIGPAARAAVQYQFDSRPHAMLGLRSCSTLKRLAKDYGHERFEAACYRAQMIGSLSIKSIRSILQRRLAELPEDDMPMQINLPLHENVRGSSYYNKGQ